MTTISSLYKARGGGGARFLPLKSVEERTSLSKSTIYALIQAGEFPKPASLTAGRRGWLESDIERWIELRSLGLPWGEDA